jgi:hypothetical protein
VSLHSAEPLVLFGQALRKRQGAQMLTVWPRALCTKYYLCYASALMHSFIKRFHNSKNPAGSPDGAINKLYFEFVPTLLRFTSSARTGVICISSFRTASADRS